jgi:hypothetical protein
MVNGLSKRFPIPHSGMIADEGFGDEMKYMIICEICGSNPQNTSAET